MSMVFLDTNVFLYAVGAAHPLREPGQNVLRRVTNGDLLATTSTELIQEILYVLKRRGSGEAALTLARDILVLFPDMLAVTRFDMEVACNLLESYPHLKTRDAIHAATMLNNGIHSIVTADSHFKDLQDLRWIPLTGQ